VKLKLTYLKAVNAAQPEYDLTQKCDPGWILQKKHSFTIYETTLVSGWNTWDYRDYWDKT
jgi:hypothetical protein